MIFRPFFVVPTYNLAINAAPLNRLLAEHPPDDPGVDTGGDTRVVRWILSVFLPWPYPARLSLLPSWCGPATVLNFGLAVPPRRLFFDLRLFENQTRVR